MFSCKCRDNAGITDETEYYYHSTFISFPFQYGFFNFYNFFSYKGQLCGLYKVLTLKPVSSSWTSELKYKLYLNDYWMVHVFCTFSKIPRWPPLSLEYKNLKRKFLGDRKLSNRAIQKWFYIKLEVMFLLTETKININVHFIPGSRGDNN